MIKELYEIKDNKHLLADLIKSQVDFEVDHTMITSVEFISKTYFDSGATGDHDFIGQDGQGKNTFYFGVCSGTVQHSSANCRVRAYLYDKDASTYEMVQSITANIATSSLDYQVSQLWSSPILFNYIRVHYTTAPAGYQEAKLQFFGLKITFR